MWKCIRCEKENQDSEEMCTACGHGKTMDYTGHRTLSKISSSVTDNWKSSQSDTEYFKEQALKHLKEAAGLLEKSGASIKIFTDIGEEICGNAYAVKRKIRIVKRVVQPAVMERLWTTPVTERWQRFLHL